MSSQMSTQALLDELAARERRVLEQLHELSDVSRSPISPRQGYASVLATPRGALMPTYDDHVASSSLPFLPSSPPKPRVIAEEEDEEFENRRYYPASRGTIANLEHDLERLHHLLRHSPLQRSDITLTSAAATRNGHADLFTPEPQRYTQRNRDELDRDVAGAREKRLRGSPATHLSTSPVAPEVKRDRREAVSYAPPPPLRPLSSPLDGGIAQRAKSCDDAAPRRSEVIDVNDDTDEDEEQTGQGHSSGSKPAPHGDAAASPRGGTAPLTYATMLATRTPLDASTRGVQSYTDARRNNERARGLLDEARGTSEWRRSPVRWATAEADVADTARHGSVRRAGEEASMLGTSALEAWDAYQSQRRNQNEETVASRHHAPETLGAAPTTPPPPVLSSFRGVSQLDASPFNTISIASPPPRIPQPSPVPWTPSHAAPAAKAPLPNVITTPATTDTAAQLLQNTKTLRAAATPPPPSGTYGLLHNGAVQTGRAATVQRAASALPRGVVHTTSWQGLKSFFSRQSRVAALLTPDSAWMEEA